MSNKRCIRARLQNLQHRLKSYYNTARKFKFSSANVLHIPIKHADNVNKLFVIDPFTDTAAILN